jgi:hypothetical protein
MPSLVTACPRLSTSSLNSRRWDHSIGSIATIGTASA